MALVAAHSERNAIALTIKRGMDIVFTGISETGITPRRAPAIANNKSLFRGITDDVGNGLAPCQDSEKAQYGA